MLEIHMVPVTNGESTLVRLLNGKEHINILFDGGLISTQCLDYLKTLDVQKLAVVVASHFHWDHVGGMSAIRKSTIEVDEYWTGDIRPFESYCRGETSSPYVLACLTTADGPLRSRNGRNRLVWDGIRRSFGDGVLSLEVIAPPYSLWQRLRQPGVAAGVMTPRQAEAYRKRLLHHPDPIEMDEEVEEPSQREGDWETVRPLGQEVIGQYAPLTEDGYPSSESDPDMAQFLASAVSPWNDMSIVVKLVYQSDVGPVSVLFPGDLTNWSYVFSHHPSNARCDLLKIPHHCSDTYVDKEDVDNIIHGEWMFLFRGLERHGPGWLERELSRRGRLGGPVPAEYIEEWHYLWRRFYRRHSPYPFPHWPGHMAAHAAVPADVIDWLGPAEAFYFPLDHGRVHLPAWTKRRRIAQNLNALYCTRECAAPVSGSALAKSCRSYTSCALRSSPQVFRLP